MQKENLLFAEEKKEICEYGAKSLCFMRTYLGRKRDDPAAAVGTTDRRISEMEAEKRKRPWALYPALAFVFSIHPESRNSPT